MDPGNRRAVVAALTANMGIAVAKFVGYAVTGAASMLAEAVHSVADTGNQALLLWGNASAQRAPNAEHPFGHGRERYFWSFVVALIIFSIGGLFAIYEGVDKFLHPHPVASVEWAVAILTLGLVLEGYSLRTAVRAASEAKKGSSWLTYIQNAKTPELPVVLLEDLGALIGLMLAIIGVSVAAWTGDSRFDAAGSIAIGVLLCVIATLLAIEMKSLLIGEAASEEHDATIRTALVEDAAVVRLIHMRTEHIGPDRLLVAAKLEFDATLSFPALTAAINRAEARVREQVPLEILIYLEPDIYLEEYVEESNGSQ